MQRTGISPGKLAWQKAKKDPFVMVSLCYILLNVLFAAFAYLFIPDNSPHADRQMLEASFLPPGSKISTVHVLKTYAVEQVPLVQGMISGFNASWSPVAADSVRADDEHTTVYAWKGRGALDYASATLQETNGKKLYTSRSWLGTDAYGRDFFSRLVLGARVSLMAGFLAVLVSLVLGIVLGALAGYFRGWVDACISWFINVVWAIPTLLLVLAVSLALGKGLFPVFLAIGLTMWVDIARVTRGQFLSLREKEFTEAARALGYSHIRVIFRHILPNTWGPLIVISVSNFAAAILIEAGLSFLGLGAPPPVPSWGNMIEANRQFILTGQAHLAILPGLAIMFLVLAFTMLGSGLQQALDPRGR